MEKKKVLFIIFGVLIFLLAVAAGLNSYFGSKQVKVEPSPEQITKITSPEPGQILFGKVNSKEGNQIGLEIQLVNPLNSQEVKILSLDISVEAQDEILKFEKAKPLSNPELTKASFEDIKISSYVRIKILTDKKIILLYD